MKDQKLVTLKCQLRVRFALVIRELDFVRAIESLHDSADLSAHRAVPRDVCE